jgi:hypothetical protein
MKLVQIGFEDAKAFYKFLYLDNHHKRQTIINSTPKQEKGDEFEIFGGEIRIRMSLLPSIFPKQNGRKS